MAIARTTRPEVIASGTVTDLSPRARRDDGKVYKYDATLRQDNGAQLAVEFWVRDDFRDADLPMVGAHTALVVSVSESREYGAALGFVRVLSENDLDLLHSRMPVTAGK